MNSSTITPLLSLPAPVYRENSSAFAALGARLTGFTRRTETYYLSNPDRTGPWKDYAEFRACLIKEEREVRVYDVAGHTIKFVIDEEFARDIDYIRNLRLQLEDPACRDEAARKLDEHPLGKRALPEDFLQYIDRLADSSYFKDFWLLNYANPEDAWQAQVYKTDFKSSAAADANGDIISFARDIDEFLCSDIIHEWCHHLEAHHEVEKKAFRTAILLEQRVNGWYVPSSYALRTFGEHWAVYGEKSMLVTDATVFENVYLRSAPRAVAFMRAFKKTVLAAGQNSSINAELLARCELVERLATPAARSFVEGFLTHEDADAVRQAKEYLAFLDNPA